MATQKELETPVLHVIVVGFHHKKGCQVEYCYPPVIAGNAVDNHELPEEWKHLPSLALPDGAHNYEKDTVFFHLPSRDSSKKTVYCVSCYRQMDAKDLLNRTADITRSTVQKSVCVLSRLPLYGLLKAKLELITHAYFDERDFSKVELLEQTFNNLNASLTESLLNGTQVFLSLSPREAVARFKHKLLVLFKLILLERRVLFFGSPVETLGTTLLSVLSLYPGMLEFGLAQAVSDERHRLVSPTMGVASLDPGDEGTGEEFVEVRYQQPADEKTAGGMNSELSELLPFVHNFPVMSEPPESPTIPRDVLSPDMSGEGRKEAEHCQRQLSGPAQLSSDSEPRKAIAVARSISVSGLEVHRPNQHQSAEKMKSASSSMISDETGSLASSVHNLLEDVGQVTQISAAQAGHILPNQQDAVKDFIHHLDLKAEGGGMEGVRGVEAFSDPLLAQSDSVEELDSPESISKIDREDCFSWEEDRLQLFLDIDEGSPIHSPSQSDATLPDTSILTPTPAPAATSIQSTCQQTPQLPTNPQSSDISNNKSGPASLSSPAKPSALTPKKSAGRLESPGKGSSSGISGRKTAALKSKLTTAFGKVRAKSKDAGEVEMKPMMRGEVTLHQDDYGFPLAIFTKGCVCHPYLSLQFHSILNDVNIRSFVMGATNILFRQLKSATDVIVEVDEGKLEIKDKELQKQLHLTTADLRFSDLLVRQVTDERSNMYLDGTEWEGSDEWVRAQFRNYLQSLLATMQTEDSRLLEDFGLAFIIAWRTTHNFRHWLDTLPHPKMTDVSASHPCTGNLSVTDVKMKLNHSMQSTERGRKINAAVVQTGKYVMQTGKAVGGAFSSARSAVSSWFTSITNDWHNEEEEEVEREKRKEGEEEETSQEVAKESSVSNGAAASS